MLTLRKLKPHELTAGVRLPGPVYDAEGRMLHAPGHALTEADHQALPPRVYTDESWSARQSTAAVVHEVFARFGSSGPVECQRRSPRRTWRQKLRLTIEERTADMMHRREIEVTTVDISCGGFSFLYRQFIPRDTLVHVRFDMLPNRPVLTGVVRDCILRKGMEHRVGVQFTGTA